MVNPMSEATTIVKPQSSNSKFDYVTFIIRAANVGGLAIIILLLSTIIASLAPGFLSPFNLFALTRNLAIDTVIGFAMMVVLACGHFNLAVGSIGVSAIMATGYLLEGLGLPIPISIAGGLATGAFMGWTNGMLVVKTGIHSFVITLATASLFFGLMLILTKAEAYRNLPAAFNVLGKQRFLGPYSSMLFVTGFVAAALLILFKYSVIGRQILASGANPLAAEMSGAPVKRAIVVAHTLSGLLASVAGVMVTARLAAALPSVGADWLLPSFLAPLLGGTLLIGGYVSVIGTLLGAILVTILQNGLVLLKVGSFWVQFYMGITLLIAVGLDRWRSYYAQRIGLT
jgi:ribose transport system permease protein